MQKSRFLTSRTPKLFVFKIVSSKFNAKVEVRTLDIPVAKAFGKRVERGRNRGEGGKSRAFSQPRTTKIIVY